MAKKKSKSSAKKKKPAAARKKTSKKPSAKAKRVSGGRTKRRGKPVRARGAKKTTQAASSKAAAPKPPAGSFVWHELMTGDIVRARGFYSRLFGWKTEDHELMPGFNYTMITNKGEGMGGMMAIRPEHGDMPSHWIAYIFVKDVDATAAQAEAMGGEIVIPPHDIPVGRWAQIKDPSGAQIAIYKSKGGGRG